MPFGSVKQIVRSVLCSTTCVSSQLRSFNRSDIRLLACEADAW